MFLLLQKRLRGFDYSEVPRPQAQQVGGHSEATTFRPPNFSRHFALQPHIVHRRVDVPGAINQPGSQQELNNYELYNSNVINPNQNFVNQPQNLQNLNNQQQVLVNQYNTQQQQQQQLQQYNIQQYLQQQQYLLNQQRLLEQQQFLIQQQKQLQQQQLHQPSRIVFPQQRIDADPQNQQYTQRQQPQYFPINAQQQEQLLYNQLLQNRRLQEEQQLRAQLNRQYNRFDLSGNSNNYVQLG